jgi:Arrestin (or S-antigen), C-terminal domain
MGGKGKVRLTATLHRLHWIAGQQCCVHVFVKNDTKKTIKNLTLSLVRTTIIFKPRPHLDAMPPTHEHLADPDACQTLTTQKQVAETSLEMGQHGTRGHVSAKGWWTGVGPSEKLAFSYFLSLPVSFLSQLSDDF